jgi:hypothetical protein
MEVVRHTANVYYQPRLLRRTKEKVHCTRRDGRPFSPDSDIGLPEIANRNVPGNRRNVGE